METLEEYFDKIKELEEKQYSLSLEIEYLVERMVIKFHPHYINDVVKMTCPGFKGKDMLIRRRDLIKREKIWMWVALGDLIKQDGTISIYIINRIWEVPVVERRLKQKKFRGEDKRQW